MGQIPGLVTHILSHGSLSGPHKSLKSCLLQCSTQPITLPSQFLGNQLIESHTSNTCKHLTPLELQTNPNTFLDGPLVTNSHLPEL